MEALTLGMRCHIRDCPGSVALRCASCGGAYCASHGGAVTIERRAEPSEARGRHWMLERVPTYTQTYALCLRCGKKPFTLALP